MDGIVNRGVVLVKRPKGEPLESDFEIVEKKLNTLKEGELLIKVLYLSLDPYMRSMMNGVKTYIDPIEIGGLMYGESVGQIIASKSSKFKVGDIVTAYTGWQEYCVYSDQYPGVYKIDPMCGIGLSAYLGVAGMPGRTAYCGLMYVGRPEPGDTLVVAAASGAVGSLVGQLAKLNACRVVGIAGGENKCQYVKNELGFDECIDYKTENFSTELAKACPNGVDIYFENVGGDVTRAVAPLLNKGSRSPICGYISSYNAVNAEDAEKDSPFTIFKALEHPPEHRFFLVTEWIQDQSKLTQELAEMVASKKIKYRESVVKGIENAPSAFIGMLSGKNFGKQIVQLAELEQ